MKPPDWKTSRHKFASPGGGRGAEAGSGLAGTGDFLMLQVLVICNGGRSACAAAASRYPIAPAMVTGTSKKRDVEGFRGLQDALLP